MTARDIVPGSSRTERRSEPDLHPGAPACLTRHENTHKGGPIPMRPFRHLILLSTLCALCALCGAFLWQAITTNSAAQEAGAGGGAFEEDAVEEDAFQGFSKVRQPTNTSQVWVEATFIQIDTADLDNVRAGAGTTLDALSGNVILDAKAKADLLVRLKQQKSFEVLGSASLVAITGGQALMQMVEEVRYPAEYGTGPTRETDDKDLPSLLFGSVLVPTKFEERDVGIRLNVTPTISPNGKVIILNLLPEASFPAGYVNFGSKTLTQPVFTSWSLTTAVYLRDGSTLVLTGVPTKNFEQSLVLGPQLGQKPRGVKSSVLLISAKIIDAGSAK